MAPPSGWNRFDFFTNSRRMSQIDVRERVKKNAILHPHVRECLCFCKWKHIPCQASRYIWQDEMKESRKMWFVLLRMKAYTLSIIHLTGWKQKEKKEIKCQVKLWEMLGDTCAFKLLFLSSMNSVFLMHYYRLGIVSSAGIVFSSSGDNCVAFYVQFSRNDQTLLLRLGPEI